MGHLVVEISLGDMVFDDSWIIMDLSRATQTKREYKFRYVFHTKLEILAMPY